MKYTSTFILSVVAKQLHCVRCAPQSRHVSPICTSVALAKDESSFQEAGPPRTLEESQYNALITMAKGHGHLVQREQFSVVLKEFIKREKFLRGHVDFITLALRRMGEFGLQQDLLTYNRLIDIFPKNRFKPKNLLDAVWPRPLPQIELALRLLTKMEEHGVRPDYTTYDLLCEVFGKTSLPVDKCLRLAYWLDKYENADPYQIKGALPEAQIELSRLTLQRVCGKGGVVTEIKVSAVMDAHVGAVVHAWFGCIGVWWECTSSVCAIHCVTGPYFLCISLRHSNSSFLTLWTQPIHVHTNTSVCTWTNTSTWANTTVCTWANTSVCTWGLLL